MPCHPPVCRSADVRRTRRVHGTVRACDGRCDDRALVQTTGPSASPGAPGHLGTAKFFPRWTLNPLCQRPPPARLPQPGMGPSSSTRAQECSKVNRRNFDLTALDTGPSHASPRFVASGVARPARQQFPSAGRAASHDNVRLRRRKVRTPTPHKPATSNLAQTDLPSADGAVTPQDSLQSSTRRSPRPLSCSSSAADTDGGNETPSRTAISTTPSNREIVTPKGVRACTTALAASSLTTSRASSTTTGSPPSRRWRQTNARALATLSGWQGHASSYDHSGVLAMTFPCTVMTTGSRQGLDEGAA